MAQRNVVVLCLDTVRADSFCVHADRIRDRAALVHGGCRAPSAWSVPSHASLFTGELPHQHGVHTHARHYDGVGPSETFLGDLPDAYHTACISANRWVSDAFGIDRFFDETVFVPGGCVVPDARNPAWDADGTLTAVRAAVTGDRPLGELTNVAADRVRSAMLDRPRLQGLPVPAPTDNGGTAVLERARRAVVDREAPVVCFANVMDAHAPYWHWRGMADHGVSRRWSDRRLDTWAVNTAEDMGPYADDVDSLRAIYDARVRYLDRIVADFVDSVVAETDRETTVVVTSDHGHNLAYPADRGLLDHTSSLTEGLLHVPFAVVNPPTDGAVPSLNAGRHLPLRRLGAFVSGLTVDELRDVTADRVAAEVLGRTPTWDDPPDDPRWDRAVRCVYEDGTKTVWDATGETRRYTLDADRPSWQSRVGRRDGLPAADTDPPFETAIESAKRGAVDGTAAATVDDDTVRHLEQLGYR
ncbi:sulfatase-like hydrolase/transferase [Haloarcula sp. JP-L23]|uniref:sulfatase-like hydrolase/transferase n=1 Tax=Haloarcula sp. JP-L23 TaxID=2716717 RepID=UPI00140EA510|nr:sulfatase-like hydrolase/transferase [Haloarcula sp. JP-L23]